MSIFITSLKLSTLSTSIIITVLGNLVFTNTAQAVNLDLDLSNWTSSGDVSLNFNQATITNAYANGLDDPSNLNISGNNPLQAFELESSLSLDDGTLGFDATDTSSISRTFTVQAEEIFTFNWTFLTNHSSFDERNDYAFVAINDLIIPLADTNSSLISSGLYGFDKASGGTFSYTFLPDVNYSVAIGVTDVGDSVTSSALLVQPIPEPLTILGTGTAIAFGTWFKRRFRHQ